MNFRKYSQTYFPKTWAWEGGQRSFRESPENSSILGGTGFSKPNLKSQLSAEASLTLQNFSKLLLLPHKVWPALFESRHRGRVKFWAAAPKKSPKYEQIYFGKCTLKDIKFSVNLLWIFLNLFEPMGIVKMFALPQDLIRYCNRGCYQIYYYGGYDQIS